MDFDSDITITMSLRDAVTMLTSVRWAIDHIGYTQEELADEKDDLVSQSLTRGINALARAIDES